MGDSIVSKMMKSNFVVSANQEAWLPEASRLFAIDPYIAHVLEREGRLSQYDEVKVAQSPRTRREEFQRDHECVDQKHGKYIAILVRRLDELLGTSYGERFWKKALSLSVLRHVNFCYNLFQSCETNLDTSVHGCKILDKASYLVPANFDFHRYIFQNTDFGQEQLFSVYCELFYPGQFASWKEKVPSKLTDHYLLRNHWKSHWQRITLQKVLSRLRRFTLQSVVRWLLHFRAPQVGVIYSFFSNEQMDKLILKSFGRIQIIKLPTLPPSTSDIQWEQRDKLTCCEADFDRFDKFVFASLRHGIPKTFVEDFQQTFSNLDAYLDNYKSLRWVVSEAWIGNTLPSLALAILRERGVGHTYNEHNYLAHPFLGNNLKYILPLVDEFASLGWYDPSIPNLVRSASLFPWVENKKLSKKKHDLLFISSIPNTRAPELNSSYGESGERVVPSYLEMNRRFFEALSEETLAGMVFRDYPS